MEELDNLTNLMRINSQQISEHVSNACDGAKARHPRSVCQIVERMAPLLDEMDSLRKIALSVVDRNGFRVR